MPFGGLVIPGESIEVATKSVSKVDYNRISAIYDNVRAGDLALVDHLLEMLEIDKEMKIVEIGCGTGTYANQLQRQSPSAVHGLDASKGMLQAALHKNPHLHLAQGSAEVLPYTENAFNFAYMIDVIHHVGNLDQLLGEVHRVLKTGSMVCIITQSHAQINARPITRFFPETATVDTSRYPAINTIITQAQRFGLHFTKREALFVDEPLLLAEDFLDLVRAKGYSMLHLISEPDYEAGVEAVERELRSGPIPVVRAGETAVWFTKI